MTSVPEAKVTLRLARSRIACAHPFRRNRSGLRVTSEQPLVYDFGRGSAPGADTSVLYTQGAERQWKSDDLPWSEDVDPYRLETRPFPVVMTPGYGTALWRGLDKNAREKLAVATGCYLLSQFLHGEQAAMVLAGQTVAADLSFEPRLFAAQQTADEARHVEVFARYLKSKLEHTYPVDPNLEICIHALTRVSEWDLKVLGLQILIEGLALGSFAFLLKVTREPLLRQLLINVIRDETRHVRFGVLVLKDFYEKHLDERQREERAAWALEITRLLHRRFRFTELHDEFFSRQVSRQAWLETMQEWSAGRSMHAQVFGRVMPNLRLIGLLTARTRPAYEELGLLGAAGKLAADLMRDEEFLDFSLE